MTTIDPAGGYGGGPDAAPLVALRVVTTYADRTRRIDFQLRGTQSVAVEDGHQTIFSTERLWPAVRDALPEIEHLRAHPRGRTDPDPQRPGPTFVADCRAHVSIATLVGRPGDDEEAASVAVRTWLATDDALWSVTPAPDGTTDVRSAPAGTLADLLIWDVTAAMETLVHLLEPTT